MRRIRNNLIMKSPPAKPTIPIEEAIKAREKNLLGENGVLHGQDRYLAMANAGDLVVPVNELSLETRTRLEESVGSLEDKMIGQGGELQLSKHYTNGVGIAEVADIPSIIHYVEVMDDKTAPEIGALDITWFESCLHKYLKNRQIKQVLIHKTDKNIDGIVFLQSHQELFQDNTYVSVEFFDVKEDSQQKIIGGKLIQAIQTWANSQGAINIRINRRIQINELSQTLKI